MAHVASQGRQLLNRDGDLRVNLHSFELTLGSASCSLGTHVVCAVAKFRDRELAVLIA